MASRHETIHLLRQGCDPAEIASVRDRTLSTITQHLRLLMGEGQLRPIDIILAFKLEDRETLDALFRKHEGHTYGTFERHAYKRGIRRELASLYYNVRGSSAFRGDIYVLIADIELCLHRLVKATLVREFGSDENQWWRQGVPVTVRKACALVREDDLSPVGDPYCYTTFIHLSDIIEANWSLFRSQFPEKLISDRKTLLRLLRQINQLRNAVMHPVKQRSWRLGDIVALKTISDLVQAISSTPNHRMKPPVGDGAEPD